MLVVAGDLLELFDLVAFSGSGSKSVSSYLSRSESLVTGLGMVMSGIYRVVINQRYKV